MKKILIIGAGVAGTDVVNEINKSPDLKMSVVGYVDDDMSKIGKVLSGAKVLGNTEQIRYVVEKYSIDEIIIAIPSAHGEIISKFVNTATELKISFRIVPRVKEIIDGRASISTIRKVNITDLLGRPVIKNDISGLKKFFDGKVVMVTGAAGSIGSELSAQIAAYKPRKIILFDVWENGIFELKQNLEEHGYLIDIEYVIGNIQDIERLEQTFKKYKPNYVFHGAAYKHVPLMEENPLEALKNNIIGSYNLAKLSATHKVLRFVLISTDKAADPKNVMGMTKLFAEKIVGSFAKTQTKYMSVRFGNVLGSNGSVIPIFKKQIESGGPVTITHKKMTRFFMTIPEACGLILKSAQIGNGGELFVLNMGDPVSILELANKMIRLSGFIPDVNIKIVYTGKRKGEKLTEKLFTDSEMLDITNDSKIFVLRNGKSFINIDSKIEKINKLISNSDANEVKSKLKKILNEK